jgi:tRNA nucleotidyltransferase (CCA-adding enzyme)
VRDGLLGIEPHDYDLATALRPPEVRGLCEAAGYRVLATGERFGTVTVLTPDPVEVTTFRGEGRYTRKRQPERGAFIEGIADDLGRRDFTLNAMALGYDGVLVDPFGGASDLAHGVLRSVGDASERLREDPLRIWRLFRLAATLPGRWKVADDTYGAALRYRFLTAHLSPERVRSEFVRILAAADAQALMAVRRSGLLAIAIPEFAAGEGFDQHNRHHTRTVAEHNARTAEQLPPGPLRLAGLVHDIAKPVTAVRHSDGQDHYYGHDEVGALMVRHIMKRLTFSSDWVERVSALVGRHMFPFPAAGPAAYRRLVADVGDDFARDLLALHVADVRARHPDNAQWSPPPEIGERLTLSLTAPLTKSGPVLAVDGQDVMRLLGIAPGPEVGRVLDACRSAVFERPECNTRAQLEALVLNMAGR